MAIYADKAFNHCEPNHSVPSPFARDNSDGIYQDNPEDI
jgi:hypothetical protein